jgi:hypothetical protein
MCLLLIDAFVRAYKEKARGKRVDVLAKCRVWRCVVGYLHISVRTSTIYLKNTCKRPVSSPSSHPPSNGRPVLPVFNCRFHRQFHRRSFTTLSKTCPAAFVCSPGVETLEINSLNVPSTITTIQSPQSCTMAGSSNHQGDMLVSVSEQGGVQEVEAGTLETAPDESDVETNRDARIKGTALFSTLMSKP